MGNLKKYLRNFDNHDEYGEFTGTTEYIKPNVSRCEEEKHVHYGQTPQPTAITFVETSITVNIDDKAEIQLEAVIEPADVKNKRLVWLTNNPKVATVDGNGLVTLNKVGKCTIWAKSVDGKVSAKCFIKCIKVTPESIELNKNVLYVQVGKTFQLEATVSPSEATQKVVWSSSNSNVASVDDSGLVSGKTDGEAIVTAKSAEYPLTASCAVSSIGVASISLDRDSVELAIGNTHQLVATVLPEEAAQDVIWSSSDESIATVGENGLVTAVSIGDAVITAACKWQGEIAATCSVSCTES